MKKFLKGARKLGTHGKFAIPYQEAHQQIIELLEIKRKFRDEIIESKEKLSS